MNTEEKQKIIIQKQDELIKSQDKHIKEIFNDWRHTLALWGYWSKIDFINALLMLFLGITEGILLGRVLR